MTAFIKIELLFTIWSSGIWKSTKHVESTDIFIELLSGLARVQFHYETISLLSFVTVLWIWEQNIGDNMNIGKRCLHKSRIDFTLKIKKASNA